MTASQTRVLGIDPGIGRCGWAVVDASNTKLRLIGSGCITTPKTNDQAKRLQEIFLQVTRIITRYQPTRAALEKLFFSKNVSTAMVVGQARGVALLAAGRAGLPIYELEPTVIKQAATGHGRAEKTQVQRMMKTLLRLPSIPRSDDEADAMAVAYCAATMRPID